MNKDLAMFNAALERALSSEIDRLRSTVADLTAANVECCEIITELVKALGHAERFIALDPKQGLTLAIVRAAIAKASQGHGDISAVKGLGPPHYTTG